MFRKVISLANWTFVGLFGLLALLFTFASDTGGGALAGLATVIALLGMVWVPIAAVTSVLGVVYEYREHGSIKKLFTSPALYVLFIVFYLLMLMFV
tara:strand:+ start:370 stop:657 length:288 start_codon:yes stop_codon:yes gene_type:complete